jgi:hypothetical protein
MNRVSPATSSRLLTSLTIAAAAVFGALPPAQAADTTCTPSIFVDNDKPHAIKVLKVAYRVNNGPWHEEGLANKTLARNESGKEDEHTWKSQKLQYLPKNNPLTDITIQYKEDNSGAGDGFGPPGWSTPSSHSGTCQDSDTYHHTISASSAHTSNLP